MKPAARLRPGGAAYIIYDEDVEFFVRVPAHCPLALVEKTLISCRRHQQNRTLNLQGTRDSLFSIVNHMLAHPEKYPAGEPQVYRDRLKKNFLTIERALQEIRDPEGKKSQQA